MVFLKKSPVIFLLFLFLTTGIQAQERIQLLRQEMIDRISQSEGISLVDFPPVIQDKKLIANAKFDRDSIFLGNVQRVFHTFDDSLSILYHEYIHFLLQKRGKYKLGRDKKGIILQWDTGRTYIYEPHPKEVALYLKHFTKDVLPTYDGYEDMAKEKKEQILLSMKESFSQKETQLFIYAPSNLAREELEAYKAQLKGEKKGLYVLSKACRNNLEVRISQLKATYKRRRAYEKKQGLERSGERKFEIGKRNK
ncbi:MAG: hypothetical protein AAFR87_31395 [Bacteroidota bacterium]